MIIQSLFKLRPLYLKLPGSLRGVLGRKFRAWAGQQKSVVATVEGITYDFDLAEYIDSSIYFSGCFEPDTTRAINRLCKPGMTVFDVGANIGCHALRFAKIVGVEGKVVAFEPTAWATAKLRRNLQLNGYQNVVLEKVALSDRDDTSPAYFRTSWLTETASNPDSLTREATTFTTLDHYAESHKIENIDMIKIDVDGHEFKVIRGAVQTLRRYHPIILIELGPALLGNNGDSALDMVQFLSDLDYKFYDESTLSLYDDTRAMVDSIPTGATINVILSARTI